MELENISVIERKGEFYVSSLQVAEHFEKEHKNVLRDIDNLETSKQFSRLNFEPSTYIDSQGKSRRQILMTRDGFTILAMGFTGTQAMAWKEKYIAAFNSMEKALVTAHGAEWMRRRIDSKYHRKILTDAIKKYIEYAIDQGSETYKKRPDLAYINFTKMEYKYLFLVSENIEGLRDKLEMLDLTALQMCESMVAKHIIDSMNNKIFYKDIYQQSKEKINKFIELVGYSPYAIGKDLFKEIENDD